MLPGGTPYDAGHGTPLANVPALHVLTLPLTRQVSLSLTEALGAVFDNVPARAGC
jgi:hypothetical protein